MLRPTSLDRQKLVTRSVVGATLTSLSRSLNLFVIFGATGAATHNHDLLASLQKANNLTTIETLARHGRFSIDVHALYGIQFSWYLIFFVKHLQFRKKQIKFRCKNNGCPGLDPSKINVFGVHFQFFLNVFVR